MYNENNRGEIMLTFDKVFEDYIRAGAVPPGGFNKNDLQGANQHKKVQAIKQIFELAEQNIQKEAKQYFAEFNVEFVLTSNETVGGANAKTDAAFITAYSQAAIDAGDKNMKIPVNLDFAQLGKQPPLIVYNAIYSNMRGALLKKREQMAGRGGRLINQTEENLQQKNEQEQEGETSLENLVLDFILDSIYALLGIRDRDSAMHFMNDYQQQTGNTVTESFFDFSSGTRDATLAHANMMTNKAQEAIAKGDGSLAVGYAQQGMMLAGSVNDMQFNALLRGNDRAALMDFCRTYASSYLAQNGIENANSVKITLNNVGELGTYYSSENRVNINVDKIAQMNNPTEVAMTLSHELTHAIDAALGGERGPGGQYRLKNNMSEDIRAAQNEDGAVFGFVQQIQNVCYHVNPNERHARVAELSALEFMTLKAGNNQAIKNTVKRSTNAFINYQNSTIRCLKNVTNPAYLNSLKQEYGQLSGRIRSSATRQLIEERFRYIDSLESQNLLGTEIEEASIEQAQQLLQQLDGLVQHRQVEQERTNTQANQME